MNTETLTGQTTRTVTFAVVDHRTKMVTEIRKFPAGTEVYATPSKHGGFNLRVCGTLFTQEVNANTVAPI